MSATKHRTLTLGEPFVGTPVLPLGPWLTQVRKACLGNIPARVTPAGLALVMWADGGLRDREVPTFEYAVHTWTLTCAFACFGNLLATMDRFADVDPPFIPD